MFICASGVETRKESQTSIWTDTWAHIVHNKWVQMEWMVGKSEIERKMDWQQQQQQQQ